MPRNTLLAFTPPVVDGADVGEAREALRDGAGKRAGRLVSDIGGVRPPEQPHASSRPVGQGPAGPDRGGQRRPALTSMRLVEILLAVVALLLLLPLMILVAVAIRIESRGPCLYRAPRIGQDGVPFTMLKFRTMRVGSDQWGALTRRNDRRVTRVGRFLRRTAIDEWPQFVNVARGEMALVGPRPEDPRYVAKYTADQRRVLSVRPGVTSAASLAFRREEAVQLTGDDWERIYTEQIMPAKLAMELACLDTAHWRTDLHVISRTLLAVLTGGWRDRGC